MLEWIAHYLALGFDRIVIYDNESTDDTAELIDSAAAAGYPVERIFWPSETTSSPQMSAYADALQRFSDASWIAFFDLDELLVLHGVELHAWLAALPNDVSAVGINWLSFGSNGRLTRDYDLMRDAFRTGPVRTMGNNKHIKTILRPQQVEKMANPHAARLRAGTYVYPNGQPLAMSDTFGIASAVNHEVAQLNHYQLKSQEEFAEKIARGRAGKRMNDPSRIREKPEVLWKNLDRTDAEYTDIDAHQQAFDAVHIKLQRSIGRLSHG